MCNHVVRTSDSKVCSVSMDSGPWDASDMTLIRLVRGSVPAAAPWGCSTEPNAQLQRGAALQLALAPHSTVILNTRSAHLFTRPGL